MLFVDKLFSQTVCGVLLSIVSLDVIIVHNRSVLIQISPISISSFDVILARSVALTL